jgi:SPP1 gp7 family putative phage head morphogenesis protein
MKQKAMMMSQNRQDSIVSTLLQNQKSRFKNKKKIIFKKPRQRKTLEKTYFKSIQSLILSAKKIIDRLLLPKIAQLVNSNEKGKPSIDSMRHIDSWDDDLDNIMRQVRVEYQKVIGTGISERIARDQATKINKLNKEDFNKSFEGVFGIIPITTETWQRDQIKKFTRDNVKLIKSIPEQYFNQVESVVSNMIQQGKMTEYIQKEIYNRYAVSESRAALIARDQTNKFNGALTELRQREVGIKQYQWSTSLDERVRPEHEERHNDIFSWDKPPSDGHPGQAINCRCEALAVIEI